MAARVVSFSRLARLASLARERALRRHPRPHSGLLFTRLSTSPAPSATGGSTGRFYQPRLRAPHSTLPDCGPQLGASVGGPHRKNGRLLWLG